MDHGATGVTQKMSKSKIWIPIPGSFLMFFKQYLMGKQASTPRVQRSVCLSGLMKLTRILSTYTTFMGIILTLKCYSSGWQKVDAKFNGLFTTAGPLRVIVHIFRMQSASNGNIIVHMNLLALSCLHIQLLSPRGRVHGILQKRETFLLVYQKTG